MQVSISAGVEALARRLAKRQMLAEEEVADCSETNCPKNSIVGALKALVGVIIAGLVLLPEGIAAVRAARANRVQTSLNLALGSALATIGLTIPVVAALALIFDWNLLLGLN